MKREVYVGAYGRLIGTMLESADGSGCSPEAAFGPPVFQTDVGLNLREPLVKTFRRRPNANPAWSRPTWLVSIGPSITNAPGACRRGLPCSKKGSERPVRLRSDFSDGLSLLVALLSFSCWREKSASNLPEMNRSGDLVGDETS